MREQESSMQCSSWSRLGYESHRLHDKGSHAVKLAISASAPWRSLASIVSRLIILTPHASPPPCPPCPPCASTGCSSDSLTPSPSHLRRNIPAPLSLLIPASADIAHSSRPCRLPAGCFAPI